MLFWCSGKYAIEYSPILDHLRNNDMLSTTLTSTHPAVLSALTSIASTATKICCTSSNPRPISSLLFRRIRLSPALTPPLQPQQLPFSPTHVPQLELIYTKYDYLLVMLHVVNPRPISPIYFGAFSSHPPRLASASNPFNLTRFLPSNFSLPATYPHHLGDGSSIFVAHRQTLGLFPSLLFPPSAHYLR